jgi:glucose/mannose transport system permease protein
MTTTSTATPPVVVVPRRKRRRTARQHSSQAAKLVLLLFFIVVFLMPVYVLLVTSFKELAEIDPSRAWDLPKGLSLDAWETAYRALRPGLLNSFKLAIPGALISAMLGSLNGFVLSKWRFPGADLVFTLFLFGMFIPYQAVMIPLVRVMTNANLQGTLRGLVLVHIIYGLPICTLIFRNYYASVPTELIEASVMDGAGMLRTYWSVILPVSAPAFVVTIIWQFTSMWNDFLFAVFLTSPRNWPVTVQLNNVAGAMVVPFNQQMAAALLASLPTLLVYILLGRYFMRGLMAGALKG